MPWQMLSFHFVLCTMLIVESLSVPLVEQSNVCIHFVCFCMCLVYYAPPGQIKLINQ